MNMITARGIKRCFTVGNGEPFYALKGIDLDIPEGKLAILKGRSGSGKTTLLNILSALDEATEGQVIIEDHDLSEMAVPEREKLRRYDIGFVFQFYNLIADLTVQENVEVVSDISEHPLNIDEVLTALDIAPYRKRFPKELSGGQQQRVAIARALIKNPKLLLCDELTGALDTKSSRSVLTFIEKINKQFGTTIVIITHNTSIADMADYVVSIKDGKIDQLKENKEKIPASELAL